MRYFRDYLETKRIVTEKRVPNTTYCICHFQTLLRFTAMNLQFPTYLKC